jgi:hypothetical protein
MRTHLKFLPFLGALLGAIVPATAGTISYGSTAQVAAYYMPLYAQDLNNLPTYPEPAEYSRLFEHKSNYGSSPNSASASLNVSAADGAFGDHFSGSASATAGAKSLKASAQVSATNYNPQAWVPYYWIGAVDPAYPGIAFAEIFDTLRVTGDNQPFDLQIKFQVDGSIKSDGWFNPSLLLYADASDATAGTYRYANRTLYEWQMDEDGNYSDEVVLILPNLLPGHDNDIRFLLSAEILGPLSLGYEYGPFTDTTTVNFGSTASILSMAATRNGGVVPGLTLSTLSGTDYNFLNSANGGGGNSGVVPEPSTWALLVTGLPAILLLRRRQRR